MPSHSRIAGTGRYLPAQVLTNAELATRVATNDEWIRSRTGIEQRHIAADDEATSDLALHASRQALAAAGIAPSDVDLIIVATTTPDMVFPSTACILQDKLGTTHGAAFDVQAVCSGFVYALSIADRLDSPGVNIAVLSIVAFAVAILLSCFTPINVGLISIAFAFLVGVVFGGMKVSEIASGFPSSLFLVLLGVTLLFSQANVNRTLEQIAKRSVRLARGNPGAIPLVFFFLAMAHWELASREAGDPASSQALARQWYERAVKLMEQKAPKDEELMRFRAEAAKLLGTSAQPEAAVKGAIPETDK